MLDGGGARGAGGPSQSRLIGEQATTHPVEQGSGHSPGQSAQSLAQPEGTLDDGTQRLPGLDWVSEKDRQDQNQVGQRHERGQVLGHPCHGAQAPEENRCGQHHDEDSTQARRDPSGPLEGGGDGVGLHHGHDQPVGDEEDDGEHGAQDRQPQSAGDVVSGAAAVGSVRTAHLEQLGKSRLAEGGGGSQDRHEPHPQHGAGAPHDQCQRHPDDVAGSHPAGQSDGEGLEGGNPTVAPVAGSRHRGGDGTGVPQLDGPGSDGEEDAGS